MKPALNSVLAILAAGLFWPLLPAQAATPAPAAKAETTKK